MLQKPTLAKVSSIKLDPLTEDLFPQRLSLPKNSRKAIQSPRFQLHAFEDLSMQPTQKPSDLCQPTAYRNRLPNLAKRPPMLKQNLLDLDLFFSRQCAQICQNETACEIKALPGLRPNHLSTRKNTNSTDSQESSFERITKAEVCQIKKATDSPFENRKGRKGKSEAKALCLVAKSKKLPFQIRHASNRSREVAAGLDLDLSMIQKVEEPGLVSFQSFQNFFQLPVK